MLGAETLQGLQLQNTPMCPAWELAPTLQRETGPLSWAFIVDQLGPWLGAAKVSTFTSSSLTDPSANSIQGILSQGNQMC